MQYQKLRIFHIDIYGIFLYTGPYYNCSEALYIYIYIICFSNTPLLTVCIIFVFGIYSSCGYDDGYLQKVWSLEDDSEILKPTTHELLLNNH